MKFESVVETLNISGTYRKIYGKEIMPLSKGVILTYSPLTNKFLFQPFSHNTDESCIQQLSTLMRKNLLFYCYGEDEVVTHYQKGTFSDLEQAATFAYKNRLPSRLANSDGLPGEVLLDLLVQLYEKDSYKLAVRPILRQNDNNEIKGYDLTYFTLHDEKITLWLGQAKLGEKSYCKAGIHNDLLEKFKKEYLAGQMFFVCDKQIGVTKESQVITDIINQINLATLEENEPKRAAFLLDCFKKNNISINIPCLAAYEESDVYCDESCIYQKIEKQLDEMQKYFSKNTYSFEGFNPRIILYIFPLKDLALLRDDKGGFYHGLR
ncbi:MAG: hypothetical protein VB012_04845 [Erysipelotrichaceae bacterium]|nr:hypothetical protein [Erysipelotrichaceae bacterium]